MFDQDKDTGGLQGKVILITGGTSGLGAQCVLRLALNNASHIYFTGRNTKKGSAIIKETHDAGCTTPLTFVECDLTKLASVKAAADKILSEQHRLDLLMANAGVMNQPPGLTADGYEVQFGTNFLSHALLIQKFLPLMDKTAELPGSDVRIVQLTSTGFRGAPSGGIRFDDLKTVQNFRVLGGMMRYGQSKLAAVLYAQELARRHPNIISVSVTPGIVSTELVSKQNAFHRSTIWLSAKITQGRIYSPKEAPASQLWCAVGPRNEIKQGAFYEPVGILSKITTKYTQDEDLAWRLWDWTQSELKQWLD
ncbi:oxidoreductase [Xylaria bambusicola]|uniref:oxidoreductase n=1 Tax=Xylaria bambusicola TaxID=326684 RepID=UPI002007EDF5|nr:oxidoreductase [Xylaria bambusicola]KAI0506898.1 oxidoreductase [Xylaria bambusicola]